MKSMNKLHKWIIGFVLLASLTSYPIHTYNTNTAQVASIESVKRAYSNTNSHQYNYIDRTLQISNQSFYTFNFPEFLDSQNLEYSIWFITQNRVSLQIGNNSLTNISKQLYSIYPIDISLLYIG